MDETKILQTLLEIKEEMVVLRKQVDSLVTKNEFYGACDEQRGMLRQWEQELKVCDFRLGRIEKRFGIP